MEFQGFVDEDFEVFHIGGLEKRMEGIRARIQPKFRALGEKLAPRLSHMTGEEMFLHIAKHARRKVNPPADTWLALSVDKRGYKKMPHFQVGLFDDRVFIWLAYINELENKRRFGEKLLENLKMIKETVPGDFVVSADHTQKEGTFLREADLQKMLERFVGVKKEEFLLGKYIHRGDPVLHKGKELEKIIVETFETLVPVYRASFS